MNDVESLQFVKEQLNLCLDVADLERPEVLAGIKRAEIIYGGDISGKFGICIFYGLQLAKELAVRGDEWDEVPAIGFKYDQSTDSLEYLCEVIELVKGSHCYGDV